MGLSISRRGAIAAADNAAAGPQYVGEIGKAQNAVSSSTLPITLSASAHTGGLVVGRVAAGGGVSVSSVTDSRGNTWTVDAVGTAGPKANIISTGQNIATLQSGDTVTINLSGSATQKAAIIDEFSGCNITSGRVDQTANGTATTTNRNAGTTGTTVQASELVVGCFAIGAVESAFANGSGFSSFATPSLVATGTSVEGEYRAVSSIGTYNPLATGSSASSNGVTVTYKTT